MMRMTIAMMLCVSVMAGAVTAKPALRDVPQIDDGLLAVGLANEIRHNCDDISARLVRAYRYVKSLESKARALGYSTEEIRAYTKSDAEKARMRARGEAYLKEHGVDRSRPETFCELGREEMAKSSDIGALLRAN